MKHVTPPFRTDDTGHPAFLGWGHARFRQILPNLAQPHLAYIGASQSRTPGLDKAIAVFATVFTLFVVALSPFSLNALGWNYDGNGGSGPTRFHPATYTAFILLLLLGLREGNPFANLISAFGRDLCLTLFLLVWAMMMYHGIVNQSLPAATLIDTFLLPMLLLVIYRQLDEPLLQRMRILVHCAFALNSLIGIGEFLSGLRLTPYIAGGILITDDWRSTALLGHPLGNALMTGSYTALLLIGAAPGLKGPLRLGIIGLQFMGMVAFGGRASLVLLVLFGLYAAARAFLRFLAGAQIRLIHLTLIACILPVILGALAGLIELGFFDKFILRFVEDKGSAQARIVMFELFRGFTLPEILLGPQQAHLSYLVRVHGLEFGIESLWVAFALYYGVLPSVLFFAGLFLFILSVMSECQARVASVFLYFFAINTTFLGIGGKTITFASLILVMMLLAPHRRAGHSSSTLGAYERPNSFEGHPTC